MPEKRKARSTGGQVRVQRATTQTTLKDLFLKTNSGVGNTNKAEDLHVGSPVPTEVPSLPAADPQPPEPLAQPSRPKPSQLFPIFTKASSTRARQQETVIDVDGLEVIDITDASSDVEPLTELSVSLGGHSSPHSEFSQGATHSPPSSPTALAIHGHESDTSLPHACAQRHINPPTTSKKGEPKRWTLGPGDVGPLPSSWSQHVRGMQHSYASGQAPVKRRVSPSLPPPDETTLNFLAKGRQPEDIPSTPLGHIQPHRSLTPQQCEQHIQLLGRAYADSHPAFTRIFVHRETLSLSPAETWTRRFRPRRANEVLGNERHALYLRDWLNALQLQLQDRRPEELAPKGPAAEIKGTSKRLEPRGVKRSRVIRSVAKKRNKKRRVDSDDDLDDFVVFSDGDEEPPDEPPGDSEDELAFCQRTLTRLHRGNTTDEHTTHPPITSSLAAEANQTVFSLQKSTQTKFADDLTNTLLLTGPYGCGKTAAVYACAEELGWEVFEVYPGIGRRNGANLDHLVGDVGRNHIIRTAHKRASTQMAVNEPTGLRGCLAKGGTRQSTEIAKSLETGTEGEPISVGADSPRHEPHPLPPDKHVVSSEGLAISGICHAEFDESRPNVRQSLVLLEEVDILFKEDAGFWPAIVDFIRCCQRPVVMTCNDPDLVPLADLPIQAILVFEPCPSPVAATFLQCLSLTEGCLVPREDLMVLYETTHSIDGLDAPDAPLYPRTEPLPLPDLRRSITQLQMLCVGARHGSASEMHQGDEAEEHVRRSARAISAASRVAPMDTTVERELWRKMNRHSELMSHVDAQLCRPPMATREALSMGAAGESEDDEVGHVVLSMAGQAGEWGEGLVFYQHDELIAEAAIQHSRGVHEEVATGPIEASINPTARLSSEDARCFRARVEHQSRMADALQGIVGPPAAMMPQRNVFLDYIPWVSYMVSVDDVLERQAWDETRGGRWTRNSMRARHTRTVAVSERQQEILRGGRLDVAAETD